MASAAVASPSICTEVFAKPYEIVRPSTVLTRTYDRSQFLGIGVADHGNFQPFRRLMQLLELRGHDPKLKTIVIEDSHLRADLYAKISRESMTREEFEREATAAYGNTHPQDVFMFEHVFPLIRKINESRGDDPIIAVPVDSLTSQTAMETAFGMNTTARPHSQRLGRRVDVATVQNTFGGSILRERETAAHFRRLVIDRYPNRKSIIIYHGAHIFKNLGALGADTDASGKVVKRAYLGWMSLVSHQLPQVGRNYNVVAVDNKSSNWAPNGQLNLPAGVTRSGAAVGLMWQAKSTLENPVFTSGSFMATIRNGSVTAVNPTAPIFDAAIIEP